MKAYRVPGASAGHRWQRTQDDAKLAGRKVNAPRFVTVDVPTDQRGLLDFMNKMELDAAQERGANVALAVMPMADPEPTSVALTSPPVIKPVEVVTLTDAETFIQNADAAQLARLAENVCWRLKELMKNVAPAT